MKRMRSVLPTIASTDSPQLCSHAIPLGACASLAKYAQASATSMARQYTTSLRCPSAASEHPVTVGSAAKQASISLPSCVGSPSKPSLGTSPSNLDGRCGVVADLPPQPKVVVDRVKRRVHALSVGADSRRVSVELRH